MCNAIRRVVTASVLAALCREGSTAQQASLDRPYTLSVPVDEVSVTFRASANAPALAERDLTVLDNGRRVNRFLSFERLDAPPVRAGVLFDTSPSMLPSLLVNRRIASLYTTRLLRKGEARAFMMRFDVAAKVTQDWTDETGSLLRAFAAAGTDAASRLGGTALFDAVYRACRDQFGGKESERTANLVLLFSDGLDNASHARLDDVITECQQTRTAVYAYTTEEKSRFVEGQKTLREMAEQSGGRLLFAHDPATIEAAVLAMEAAQGTEYRVVYKPPHLKHDGAFHKVKVEAAVTEGAVEAPSGYYAR